MADFPFHRKDFKEAADRGDFDRHVRGSNHLIATLVESVAADSTTPAQITYVTEDVDQPFLIIEVNGWTIIANGLVS